MGHRQKLSRIWNCLNGWKLGLGEPQIFSLNTLFGIFFFKKKVCQVVETEYWECRGVPCLLNITSSTR